MKFIQIFCAFIFLFIPNVFTQTSSPVPASENPAKIRKFGNEREDGKRRINFQNRMKIPANVALCPQGCARANSAS